MIHMNLFRVLGDVSHTVSKCILIWAIHSNKSAEGVSLITQVLYALVFCTRYLDLFWVPPAWSIWNFVLKNFFIFSSLYTIFLMMRIYARTREREKAWTFGAYCLGGSILGTPIVALIFRSWDGFKFMELLWVFSIILESVCVLPQLVLLRQTTVPTVLDTFYLVTLGSYRAFYILNWIVRLAYEGHFEPVAVIFGIIQTAFYADFAWVYWSRQRVKLRNGGVIDSEDISRGWLIGRIMGRGHAGVDEEEGTTRGESNHDNKKIRWGPRGISVSADEYHAEQQVQKKRVHPGDPTSRDDDFSEIFEDFGDEDETTRDSKPTPPPDTSHNIVLSGSEWRNENHT